MLSTCCWGSIVASGSGTIFGCCQLLLLDQRPGVFIRLIVVGFRPSFSGVNALCWGPSDSASEVDLSSMLSVLRWGLSDGELAVARTVWQVSVVGGVRSLFDCLQLLLRSTRFFVSEVDFFAGQRFVSGDLPLALISQFVCHNCSVPGFTDGAGFRFGWVRQLLRSIRFSGFWGGSRYWSSTFCLWRCRKNRKPPLDFSSRCLTSFEAGPWTHHTVEYVGLLGLVQIY